MKSDGTDGPTLKEAMETMAGELVRVSNDIGNGLETIEEDMEELSNALAFVATELQYYTSSLEQRLEDMEPEALECHNCGKVGCPHVVLGDEDEPYCSIECLNEVYAHE